MNIRPGRKDNFDCYDIDVQDESSAKMTIHGYKVVFCGGTGTHRSPPELKGANNNKVMSLDAFAKLGQAELTKGKKIVVIGENAAIDAVHKAIPYGLHVDWLISKGVRDSPPILATQPRMQQRWKDRLEVQKDTPQTDIEKSDLSVYRYDKYTWAGSSSSVTLVSGGDRAVTGDYYVYGVGPDGSSFMIDDKNSIIDNAIMEKFRPITDKSRVVSADSGPATILGYAAEGTGLRQGFEVFGAMSGSLGRELEKKGINAKVTDQEITERMQTIKFVVDKFRSYDFIATRLNSCPFLNEKLDSLQRFQQRDVLKHGLEEEISKIVDEYKSKTEIELKPLRQALETLKTQLLAYHDLIIYKNKEHKDEYRPRLNNIAKGLPEGAVADHGQLTSIDTALRANAVGNGWLPEYMPKQVVTSHAGKVDGKGTPVYGHATAGAVDFNRDDQTSIAIYVAVAFPNVQDREADEFVARVMNGRHRSPQGFTGAQAEGFKAELRKMDEEGKKRMMNQFF